MNSKSRATAAPRSRPVSRGKRLGFVLLTGLGAWLICEAGAFFLYWILTARPFSWERFQNQRIALLNDVEGPKPNIVSEVHPYVGFVEKPRPESSFRRFADGRPMPVSRFGYVDDKEPIVARRPDRIIIAILGGSVACHFAINGAAQLGAQLSHSPEFAGKELVFVNLALAGYKQPQQLMTLAYLLSLGAQFDLALNIDGFNEVALYELENSGRNIFPAFPRSWQVRISSADPDVLLTTAGLIANEEQRNDLAPGIPVPLGDFRLSLTCTGNSKTTGSDALPTRSSPATTAVRADVTRTSSPARRPALAAEQSCINIWL